MPKINLKIFQKVVDIPCKTWYLIIVIKRDYK